MIILELIFFAIPTETNQKKKKSHYLNSLG